MKETNIIYRTLRCLFKERGMEDFLLQYYHITQTEECPPWFNEDHGLCFNFLCYKKYYYFTKHLDVDEMYNMFNQDKFSDHIYPFGCDQYFRDRDNRSHHKNQKRITWIKDTLKTLYNIEVE